MIVYRNAETKTPLCVGVFAGFTCLILYYCLQNHKDLVSPECPRHIGAKKADTQAWEKICEAVDKPEYLLGQAHNLVEELRAGSANLHEEQARI